ncbi:MAG TPA: tRNA (guanosine(37)-N1)-methyltransferase TrmD [Streptosporangiaceae bacterium]|nr:tRNA (guanosine(37)-N1)-methyltransferase TrmD [Streptosporangiaceae bacterium]
MRIDIITIFPEYFGPLGVSLIGKAADRGDITFGVHDLRHWTHDPHRTVDDTPFGGGPGMVMKPDPWGEALTAVVTQGGAGSGPDTGPLLLIPTPAGLPFTQQHAERYAAESWLIFACGRYEGIDARVAEDARTRMRVEEVSIGDYVLAGGEPAVLVMTEAVCRLLPGVLGNAESAADDSFGAGLLEGPAYTRPRVWRGRDVPEVLLSGDHAAIGRWRRDAALRRTAENRPDLVARLVQAAPGLLDSRDRAVLAEAGFPVDGEDMAH